jgi:hypothetical protein
MSAPKYLQFTADLANLAIPFVGKLGWFYINREDLFIGVNSTTPPSVPPQRLFGIDYSRPEAPFVFMTVNGQQTNFPMFVTANPEVFVIDHESHEVES